LSDFKDEKRQKHFERLVKIRDHIQRRLNESFDEPKHFEKVQWFARYWNKFFYRIEGLTPIQGPDVAADRMVGLSGPVKE
jgi:hypothetical protein